MYYCITSTVDTIYELWLGLLVPMTRLLPPGAGGFIRTSWCEPTNQLSSVTAAVFFFNQNKVISREKMQMGPFANCRSS